MVGAVKALAHAPGAIKEGFVEARRGLRSSDFPTRRMSIVFYLSLLGVGLSFYGFGRFVMQDRARKHAQAQVEADRLAVQALRDEEERRSREPPPYQTLGTFTLELREEEGVARSSGLRAAEMEIVVACSSLVVCDWIKANIDRSRGELSPLFTPTDREKILSTGGKKALRDEIRDALNRLLDERGVSGTVLEVLFPRFIVS